MVDQKLERNKRYPHHRSQAPTSTRWANDHAQLLRRIALGTDEHLRRAALWRNATWQCSWPHSQWRGRPKRLRRGAVRRQWDAWALAAWGTGWENAIMQLTRQQIICGLTDILPRPRGRTTYEEALAYDVSYTEAAARVGGTAHAVAGMQQRAQPAARQQRRRGPC